MKKVLKLLCLAFVLANTCLQVNAQNSNAKNSASEGKYVYNMAMVEVQPEFPDGIQALYKWLLENINYPVEAIEEGVQGKIIVEFVISTTGEIENARVLRGRHPALDKEAIRVVKAMPKWTPGSNNGKPVKVLYTLPVTFKLPQKQKTAK